MISPFLIFLHIKTLMPLLYIPILLSIVLLVSGYVAFKGSNKNVILQFIHCDTNNKIVGILFLHLANNNNANRISRNILYFLRNTKPNKIEFLYFHGNTFLCAAFLPQGQEVLLSFTECFLAPVFLAAKAATAFKGERSRGKDQGRKVKGSAGARI